LPLGVENLVDAALVTAAVERRLEPQREDLVGESERDSRAVYRSWQSAARTPATLLAAICSP
jgi:hypothetical protein